MTILVGVVALFAATFFVVWTRERRQRRTHPVAAGLRPEISLPFEEEFELYHNALSLCSMKIRVCLAELDIPYRSHPIDLIETGAYETLSRHFLSVNPAATVPVLVHDGHPVYESHEQIRYAAAHAPPDRASLVPDDPALRSTMERWIDRSSLTEDPIEHGDESAGNAVPGLTLAIFAAMIDRIGYTKILEGVLFHFDKKRPFMFLLFKAMGLERMGKIPLAVKLIARSRKQMDVHLDALEKELGASGGPWILGDPYSLADVSWLVIFERLAQLDTLHAFAADGLRPGCAAYFERLRARPAYREAILEHPHPLILYGTNRIRSAKAADPALRAVLEGRPASAAR
jgi:glutathione S-transferase